MGIIDNVANRKLKNEILSYNCILAFGDRGCGKSSLLALASYVGLDLDRQIFCNYPIKNAYQIPSIISQGKDGVIKSVINKEWLYSTEFPRGSLILLDEVSTIWNARNFKNWTDADSEFFNFIRKEEIQIILATQYYDQVDLNVKRACDVSFFIHQRTWLKNTSYIEVSKTNTVKVADNSQSVLGKDYKKGAELVHYDVAEIPLGTFNFYRKPYYDKFDTYYVPFQKNKVDFTRWNDLITI